MIEGDYLGAAKALGELALENPFTGKAKKAGKAAKEFAKKGKVPEGFAKKPGGKENIKGARASTSDDHTKPRSGRADKKKKNPNWQFRGKHK
jgi:hypothetical protein